MCEQKKTGQKLEAHCGNCGGDRNCEIKGFHIEKGSELGGDYMWQTEWYLLTCCGCNYVFAQSISSNSEDYYDTYDYDGDHVTEYIETVDTWPARSKRDIPDWFKHKSVETDLENTRSLDASLNELYGALDADLLVLASIGIRTSFDIAAELLGVDPAKSFNEKLKELVSNGHILEASKENVEILVDAGSASAHRGWKPSSRELGALMGALEDFIYSALVFPARSRAKEEELARIKSNVPRRPKRQQKGKTKSELKA
ncbi:DUF4145 domain-containing protein [Ruegeria sp. HKCCC1038]|uniref:DUF4145 domain-containing protein n=1 Tax=Ruegeria sp. HKCCC1038 TaxID=2682982 RepID=UPI0014883DAE|nr:DUF4145 domain-containing protein [Ruegeria sp. HKCCC1038]